MLKMIKLNKTNIILVGIFFVYLISCFYVGTYHEPWSDEAQSWLLARDNSVFGLIFNELKYEGHPILWFLILKVAQILHLHFENITYLALFFSSIGVYLLLFKTKIPMFFKATIPFCYYIFYQYSVIARNHSLVFPILMLLAIIYPQKENKVWQYSILLILLTSISLHSYVISFVLFVDLILSLIKNIDFKKHIPPIALTGLNFLLTASYLKRPDDSSFPATFIELKDLFFEIPNTISSIFFNLKIDGNSTNILSILLAIFVLYFICKTTNTICKTRNQKILIYTLHFSFLTLLILFYNNDWHLGYQFLIIIFSLVAMFQTNNLETIEFKTNKFFYICFAIILITQIFWNVKSAVIDRYFVFDPGRNVAEYLKKNQLENKKIEGMYFQIVSINPYFEKNIFSNLPKSHWYWRKSTGDFNIQFSEKPILIFDWSGLDFLIKTKQIKYVEENYKTINFHGVLVSKGILKEDLSLTLCIPKDKEDK